MLKNKNILLIISGGIAAYKVLDLIRLIKKNQGNIRCIITKAGSDFVTPLSISSLSQNKIYTDNDPLTTQGSMTHIELSRKCDLIVVAPASADIMAKMANGLANDLASTTLLASNKPILVAPAMNPEMWENPATKGNVKILENRGVLFSGPVTGEMACGESGFGRMNEVDKIFKDITDFLNNKPLKGYNALVTSGPTYEPIDPVRFIGNKSSGKQGHAIAKALRNAGAGVTLISGPTRLNDPHGIDVKHVETAKEMFDACMTSLPVNIAVCAAAVSDWSPSLKSNQKIKKTDSNDMFKLELKKNTDILKNIANHKTKRPNLVIGFAAETENLIINAKAKLENKNCDWIIANEVGLDNNKNEKTFGLDQNQIYLISQNEEIKWARDNKDNIAQKLVQKIINHPKLSR